MIDTSDRHPLDVLTEEFVARHRRGERPLITEYTDRHPDLADRIRTLFPTALMMEELKHGITRTRGVVERSRPVQLGDYRILREIGRGGMGVVYEAEQESLGRHVAVKVLPAVGSPEQAARFHREAQAAARLHHTNIVPVFGVGEQDGVPYYVMQKIDGLGLDHVLAELRHARDNAPDKSQRQTEHRYWRRVARMIIQAAEALAHAHAQGTLHLDIKPGNLLLDQRGTVWVTDFGLAHFVGQDRPAEFGGTLRYMAPERFAGKADARSDTYSLGLTLYEFLTLRPAFESSECNRLTEHLAGFTPAPPRSVNRDVPRDLEAITMKAIAPEPEKRYQTAGELADDLQRFLDDRPVKARPIGLMGRGWRWCRRNRVVAVLLATVTLLILGVTVGSVTAAAYFESLAVEKEEARAEAVTNGDEAKMNFARAEEERKLALAQGTRAEANLSLALEAMDEILEQLSAHGLSRPLEPILDEEGRQELHFQPVVSEGTAALFQNALKFYDRFADQNADNPRLRRDTARAHRRVGDIQQRLGQFAKAEAAYRRALGVYEKLEKDAPSGEWAREMAEIQNELGLVLQTTGRYAEAQAAHKEALKALQPRMAKKPTPEDRYELARAHLILGSMLWTTGDLVGGETNLRSALDQLDTLAREDNRNPEYRQAQARVHRNLMTLLLISNRPKDAVASSRRAVSILEQLAEEFPTVPDYRYELSEVLALSLGRAARQDAEARLRKALDLAKGLTTAYPAVPQYQALRARVTQRLGAFLQVPSREWEAEKLHREAVKLERNLVEQFPSVPLYQFYLAEGCHSLGVTLTNRNNPKDAAPFLEEAEAAEQAFLKANTGSRVGQWFLVGIYQSQVRTYTKLNDTAKLEEATRKADELRKKLEAMPGGWPGGFGQPGGNVPPRQGNS